MLGLVRLENNLKNSYLIFWNTIIVENIIIIKKMYNAF